MLGLGGWRALPGSPAKRVAAHPGGGLAIGVHADTSFEMNHGKDFWRNLAQNAFDALDKVCPGSTHADRKDFIAELETNKQRMGRLKKQRDKKGRSMGDTLRDWFRAWLNDRVAAGAAARKDGRAARATISQTTSTSATSGDDGGWTTHTNKKPTKSAPSTSTAPTATPRTTTSLASSTRPPPAQRRQGARRGDDGFGDVWRDLEVAEDTPLVDVSTGEEATQLDLSAPAESATGYFFCNSQQAADLYSRYARAINPITFILPPYDNETRDDIKKALEKQEDYYDGAVKPSITNTTMFVKEPSTGRKRNVAALLIHVDRAKPILPPQQVDDGMLFADVLPSVDLDLPTDVELQLTVIGPICRELALTDWWEKLRARQYPHFKDDIKHVITSVKFKPSTMQARMDRRLVWRGETMEGARITTTIKAPADQAEDLMARSGRHGIIIDRVTRGRGRQVDEYAKIKLPLEYTMADALAKVDALPPNMRKATRGVVPTARGYALRVVKQAEADITAQITPEVAVQLGPALGLQAASTWVVRGIPREATKEGIIRALNAPTARWQGWTARPIRTMAQPRNGKVDWLVEAEVDPPSRALTVKSINSPHGDCIMVEKHTEEKRIAPRAAAWFKQRSPAATAPPPKSGALWGDLAELDDDEDFAMHHYDGDRFNTDADNEQAKATGRQNGGDGDQGERASGHLCSDSSQHRQPQVPRDSNGEALTRRLRAAGFRTPQMGDATPLGNQAPGARTTEPPPAEQANANAEIMEMLRTMQESIKGKDALITQLQETIKGLNNQIAAMGATLNAMQAAATAAQQNTSTTPTGASPSTPQGNAW